MSRLLTTALLGIGCGLLVLACEKKDAPKAAPAPVVASAIAAPSAAPVPKAPWYVGKWTGAFEAKQLSIELEPKAANETGWQNDEGTEKTGAGTLEIQIDEGGRATGSATGALGELKLNGMAEADHLTLRLEPSDPTDSNSVAGVLVLKHEGGELKGTLRVSTGDSQIVRRADVSLKKSS